MIRPAERPTPARVQSRQHPFWTDLPILFLAVLVLRVATAWLVATPGYMDAYYYYVGAARIADGHGLTEPYLWNYLSQPLSLPAPAFRFWLPLTSFLLAPFLALFGSTFRAAQAPLIVLSSLIPLIAYVASYQMAPIRRRAVRAALLTAVAPFYLHYWVVTDNFTPFALAGGLALLAMRAALREARWRWYIVAGALVGLCSLTRADGPLLLIAFALVAFWPGAGTPAALPRRSAGWGAAALTCLLVMAPWFLYQWIAVGSPTGGSGLQTAFLRSYDDLYAYGRSPTLGAYLAWGWPAILRSKLNAAGSNLLTVLAVFLSIFLAPLAAVEMWARRREAMTRLVAGYLLLLFLIMTFVFTFPGPRGSLLHSGAALLPFLLALASGGLDRSVAWVAQRRKSWSARQASDVLGIGALALSLAMGGFLFERALVGSGPLQQAWNTRDDLYQAAGQWLSEQGIPMESPILVVDAPGFYYATGRPSLALPNDPPDVAVAICRRFGASYLLLQKDHPQPLDGLYAGSETYPALTQAHEWKTSELEGKLFRCPPPVILTYSEESLPCQIP